jgi:hypothetical protein
MTDEQRDLGGFEQRLLEELKLMLALERPGKPAATTPVPNVPGRRRWGRRLALASALAAVAALALATGLPLVEERSGPAAAYAVATNEDGRVVVEIREIRDAEGLERKLREAGIPAIVHYLPPGKACKELEDTFTLIDSGSTHGAIGGSEDGTMRFEIDRSSLGPGQKLVIYTRGLAPGQPGGHPRQPFYALALSVAEGKVVTDCEVVDAAGVPESAPRANGVGEGTSNR